MSGEAIHVFYAPRDEPLHNAVASFCIFLFVFTFAFEGDVPLLGCFILLFRELIPFLKAHF